MQKQSEKQSLRNVRFCIVFGPFFAYYSCQELYANNIIEAKPIFRQQKKLSRPVAEFKEFERRFNGWFHLNLYQMFQDLSRRLI